ncbi:TIGR02444 family protein [Cellvibrio sp. NN19]|uniref:TIGR02444 family protein n=1 Tax=Cellvibrio chitinivorans TaxID=3102792 RepID=UPI002B41713D|nr:TIGR02444 family protein [Cellvibrio sp. NN19]
MPSALSDDLSGLWNFSLDVYARAGVADACLRLQDEHGANVNLLLWCAWLGAKGYSLEQEQLLQAQRVIASWDENYVKPLRALRRKMKSEFGVGDANIESVRNSIKQAELHAERQLQFWLEQVITDGEKNCVDAGKIVRANILLYLSLIGVVENAYSKNLFDALDS